MGVQELYKIHGRELGLRSPKVVSKTRLFWEWAFYYFYYLLGLFILVAAKNNKFMVFDKIQEPVAESLLYGNHINAPLDFCSLFSDQ
jgi:hypothetical protein